MATRSIVTSQPDVACDVCERRLLRGEQHEVFLVGDRRRTVCELCAPRAAHAGWLREDHNQSVSLPAMRPRGRGLFERLRQVGKQAAPAPAPAVRPAREGEPEPYDFLDAPASAQAAPASAGEADTDLDGERAVARAPGDAGLAVGDLEAALLERATEVFNASAFPRRVAGVARSLGPPAVSIRSGQEARTAVIVVAWELCWYRYGIDLGEETAQADILAQGTEIRELTHEERIANALAAEDGSLSFGL